MLGTGTTRRSVLGATAAAGAALLTGCSERSAAHRTQGAAAPRAGTVLRQRSARTSAGLLALYDAVLARHRDTATEKLAGPLRDAVALHVKALAPPAGSAPSATPGPSRKASPAPAPPGVPADREAALKALAAAERRATDAHTAALADAPPELARLLASVAAASAVHAYLLTQGDH
ncbi:twin-arginine translocation signal domain-containing protein [Streptomyces sp. NPDC006649]|uniref:twin-arginine translocation signal domain-containing protein n=1 Tax=Streptomyces sp. NPDC006649 TaxID=3156896 RepID=UPI0033B3E071